MTIDDTEATFGNWTTLPWLRDRTILLTRHGSHAFGLNTPTSDLDLKGVAVPPRECFLGFSHVFQQAEHHDPDVVIYDIRKFCNLAADCNPSIIEVLWCDESDYQIMTPAGRRLVDARDLFLSKKARHTFSGYAMSQLKRINLHQKWLRSPPKAKPLRADYGLPECTVVSADQLAAAQSAIDKKLATWNLADMSGIDPAGRIAISSAMAEALAEIGVAAGDEWKAAARSIGYSDNFLLLLGKEREYKSRMAEWDSYQNWIKTRNPKRAALETVHGYDTKHAMHLVRLMRMCREILETGNVVVKRPDREELLAIRNGAWAYERLVEWAASEDKALADVYAKSSLRHSPDRGALDRLCVSIVEDFMRAEAA